MRPQLAVSAARTISTNNAGSGSNAARRRPHSAVAGFLPWNFHTSKSDAITMTAPAGSMGRVRRSAGATAEFAVVFTVSVKAPAVAGVAVIAAEGRLHVAAVGAPVQPMVTLTWSLVVAPPVAETSSE